MQDMRQMQVGQIVDFCISYNERQKSAEKPQKRKATQAEINSFFG